MYKICSVSSSVKENKSRAHFQLKSRVYIWAKRKGFSKKKIDWGKVDQNAWTAYLSEEEENLMFFC